MTQIVPVRIEDGLLAELDQRAASDSTSRSAVIRAALSAYLRGAPLGGPNLSADDYRRITAISERYGLASLELFGSCATGRASASSDVDLLYTLRPERRLGWEIEDLNAELADVFGRPVDLVAREALHPHMRDAVLREARAIYAA